RYECLAINPAQRLKFPEKGKNILKFTRFSRQNPHHWVVYADFVCMLVPLLGLLLSTLRSSSMAVSRHVPISYGYAVIDNNDEIVEDSYYYETDAVRHFL